MDKDISSWKTVDSTYIVNDRWLKLRADTCLTPDGHTIAPYYVMEYGAWANCVVVSDANEVTLLRHYRYAANRPILEIIGGMVDENETPEEAIRRELEEEIGLKGAVITATGVAYPNPSIQTNKVYSFIAQGGSFDGRKEDEAGANFEVVKMPLSQLQEIIENQGEVMQTIHLTSIFFALNHLKKHA